MLQSYRGRLLASSLLACASVLGSAASAQDAAPPSNSPPAGVQNSESAGPVAENSQGDIVVTGSLITNPNLVASAPVTVVGQEEIQLRQSNTAEQILRDLPGAVPSVGSAVNNGNGGASYVNLRGLGSNRNIVLLDGQRIVPGDLVGRVDLNNIPLALVERVDSLTGGAATTYGADAVSGVVNFITRSDFSGLEAQVSNQITEDGDGNYIRADVTVGANFDDGRGNAVFSIGYQQADPVYQGERSFSVFNINGLTGATGPAAGSGTSIPSRFSRPGSPVTQIDPSTGALRSTFSLFNFNPYNIFQTPFERFNMYGAGHYEVSDGVEVYTRGLFSKNTVKTILAPGGSFGETVAINYSNPYLPAAARAQFCASNGLTVAQCNAAATATSPTDPNYRTFTTAVSRRTPELGPRLTSYTTQIFDYRLGVKIGIVDNVNLDLSGGYGESENNQVTTGNLRSSRLRQAAQAVNVNGVPTCVGTVDAGCVPVNLFGNLGSITAEQGAFLAAQTSVTVKSSLAQARALLSGDFGMSSPFADDPIGFAAGAEYRKYNASQVADVLSQVPGEVSGTGGASPNISGGFEVYEGYGELIAPLVQDRPFFKSLTLEAGVRYSHYKIFAAGSPSFNTTTYKAGGSWEPMGGLKVRGNYQRAVRAPNINELFSPVQTTLTNISFDPCATLNESGTRIAAAPSGNLRAVCLAQGATASTVDTIQPPTAGQGNSTQGGNVNLKPEKSNSYTVGVVLQPSGFASGLSITVDYYNIKIKGSVGAPTPGDAIAACFNNLSAASATDTACTSIRRNPLTGGLDGSAATTPGLLLASTNLGKLKTDGIDLGVNYRRDLGFANMNLNFQGNWTHDSKFQASPLSLNRECTSYYSLNCASIQPEFYWNARATFSRGAVDLSLLWRHISKAKYEPAAGTIFSGTINGQQYDFNRIPAFDYFDLSTRFGVSENVDLTVTVTNLFNKQPPITGSNIGSTSYNSGNTYPSTYDALGRRFSVAARLKF